MKLITATAFTLLAAGAASAQGIFNITPNDEVTESLPLTYQLSGAIGWDDNVTPNTNDGEDSLYGSLDLGANFVSRTAQTNFDFNAVIGATYYFDDVEGPAGSSDPDDTTYNARLALNISHQVSERLRVSSRNFVNYGLEPDYSYSFADDRSLDEYLYWSTDNAIGYKWTDRFATYTGVRYDSLDYDDDASSNDRDNFTAYNQFRYLACATTVYTLDYRYRWTDNSGGNDSDNQTVLLGIEHKISENSTIVARGGAQFRDVDGGDNSTSPSAELSYRNQVNEQFKFRLGGYYGVDDYTTSFPGGTYDENRVVRISAAGDYYLSSQMYFTGGVNYSHRSYKGGDLSAEDVDLINLHAGVTYLVNDCYSMNLTYNFTTSDSDIESRDYDRNRVELGMTYQF